MDASNLSVQIRQSIVAFKIRVLQILSREIFNREDLDDNGAILL